VSSPDSVRLKLTIHYDGTRFHGWQVQPDVRTVQGVLEEAAERLTEARRAILGSGRTDAGVHARGQVASLTVPVRWTATEFRRAMNAVLPDDVWLAAVEVVADGFHPRFHPVARSYLYQLGLTDAAKSPFVRPWCWPLDGSVDLELLDAGAERMVGTHSFASFAKAGQPQRGDRCSVRGAGWTSWADLGVRFSVTADRYLHHMVRYMVGTMVDVARGRRPLDDIEALLDPSRDDVITSPPAPSAGLFLERVEYPADGASGASLPSSS